MTATAHAVAPEQHAAPRTSSPRVPATRELGLRLESKELAKMVAWLQRQRRAGRAPVTWAASAAFEAVLIGADHRNSRVYRKSKTLAHDAGLKARSYFYALGELEALGAIAREYIAPRDPRLTRCSHRLKSRCGCPWNKGQTVLTVLVHSHAELLGLARAQETRAGLVLVRPPRRVRASPRSALNAPMCTESQCTSSEGVDPESQCISLSVSTTLLSQDPPTSLSGLLGGGDRREDRVIRARPAACASATSPNNRPTEAREPEGAPAAHAHDANGFEPADGAKPQSESTEGGRAQAVPSASLEADVDAVLAVHRRELRPGERELRATWIERRAIAHALARGWTRAELEDACVGARLSPYNIGARTEVRAIFATDECIDALIAVARRRRPPSVAPGGRGVPIAAPPSPEVDVPVSDSSELAARVQRVVRETGRDPIEVWREILGGST